MDCAKGTVVSDLNDDMMVEILSRVPVKDVRRSKCVSKPWRDLITNPLHRKKLPQTLEGFFHGSVRGHCNYGHFTSLSGSGEFAPPIDPSFSFLTAKLPGVERLVLLDSCNGLLLFGCIWENKSGYIVCNPATKELLVVPASSAPYPPRSPLDDDFYANLDDEDETFVYTFLMFDPAISPHFNLVQIWETYWSMEMPEPVHAYSSETRAWTDRSSKWKPEEEGGEWGLWGHATVGFGSGRALVNGLLHLVVHNVRKNELLIVAVDGKGKACRTIDWQVKDVMPFIGQSQGQLHIIDLNLRSQGSCMQMSIWVLEDYDTQKWILKHNVSSSQFFRIPSRQFEDFYIVAIHPNNNSIILLQIRDPKLVSYNMDSKELRTIHTLGNCYLLLTPYVPCFMELPFFATKD